MRSEVEVCRADSEGTRPTHLDVAGVQGGVDDLYATAVADHGGGGVQRGERHRAEEVDGQPHNLHRRGGRYLLDRPGEQTRRRASVLMVIGPTAAGQFGRDEAVTVAREQCGHGSRGG